MKLDQLRKIIREEVRSAVKSELQEVMNEAIKIASNPSAPQATVNTQRVPVKKPIVAPKTGKTSLDEMLRMTKSTMTNQEYKNVFSGTSNMVQGGPNMASSMASQMGLKGGPAPGIDISSLDFVKKAGDVFKASNEMDAAKQLI